MIFPSKNILGLDIGTSTIKIAELSSSRSKVTLNRFSIMSTPIESVASAEFTEVFPISEVIMEMLKELKSKRKQVCIGLFGPSIVVKKISIPEMDHSLVAEQIRWEAEQYIPFELSEVNVDFHILNNSTVGPGSMDVLLIASRHHQIVKMVEIAESSSLTCSHLDVSGFALANCYFNNYTPNNATVTALLNIGANFTNFVVVKGEDVIFCRDIPIGGIMYTAEIQKVMNVDFDEAEALKLNVDVGGGVPSELSQALEGAHELVCDEIQGSFEFFSNTANGLSIQSCYITGGASRTPGLLEYLSRSLGIGTVETMDPFNKIHVNSKFIGSEFQSQIRDYAAVAIGLGLRKIGDTV
ncbi:MAG: type IV pilus assembly protein PilM [Bdellovibrionaceae bacterium]|nr:type IV pilus assembly protein PilM [Pseudobdellovibrionaceae bacterium]